MCREEQRVIQLIQQRPLFACEAQDRSLKSIWEIAREDMPPTLQFN
jgi:hypothetical protein